MKYGGLVMWTFGCVLRCWSVADIVIPKLCEFLTPITFKTGTYKSVVFEVVKNYVDNLFTTTALMDRDVLLYGYH